MLPLDGGHPVHLFDSFVLANYLLCSAVKDNSRGRSTDEMQRNCSRHFQKAIEVLQPTLVIIQGHGVRKWIAQAYNYPWEGQAYEQLDLGGGSIPVLTFYHPSYPQCAWGQALRGGQSRASRYLDDTIIPAISRFRSETWPSKRSEFPTISAARRKRPWTTGRSAGGCQANWHNVVFPRTLSANGHWTWRRLKCGIIAWLRL